MVDTVRKFNVGNSDRGNKEESTNIIAPLIIDSLSLIRPRIRCTMDLNNQIRRNFLFNYSFKFLLCLFPDQFIP
jgi:hypothetical protein